ncbi:MAG TPA: 1,4-dihydroxy-2-naphthoate polyprenyltransferase [Anaerolineales bacterium]|nr:1,4-dihydroxy-2-naphthoate polyprenyltransferase [Anaerolineales bacterium]
MQQENLTKSRIWLLAARPKTLPAAAAPVLLGIALAYRDSVFAFLPALASLAGAMLIQIGTNFANDYYDFKKGADTTERLGPLRVTQAGLLKPEETRLGMWLVFGAAALIGLYLVWVAGWPVVVIGLASIAAGIAYTGGPFPLGYNGLGDLFVFIFFGLVAVGGTYFVQAGGVTREVLLSAAPIGLLATAILVVNNLRDIETDRKAGKRTLAVRLGVEGTRTEFVALVAGAYVTTFILALTGVSPPGGLLTWLSLPIAVPLVRSVRKVRGKALNEALARTGRLELVFALLFSLGLIISNFD